MFEEKKKNLTIRRINNVFRKSCKTTTVEERIYDDRNVIINLLKDEGKQQLEEKEELKILLTKLD